VADLDLIADRLSPRNPAEVQAAALRTLARVRDDRAADRLLASWDGFGPSLRGAVLDALLARPSWSATLLTAIERGAIAPAAVDASHRQRLLTSADAS